MNGVFIKSQQHPNNPILSKLSNRCDVHTYNVDSKSKPYCAMYYLYK